MFFAPFSNRRKGVGPRGLSAFLFSEPQFISTNEMKLRLQSINRLLSTGMGVAHMRSAHSVIL